MSHWRHSGIVVREARPRDLDAIVRLENQSFESDRVSRRSLREFLRAAHRPVIAATIDDELAGYAIAASHPACPAPTTTTSNCSVKLTLLF